MVRCDLQEGSESESVTKSNLGEGEFGSHHRKRRSTQASRENSMLHKSTQPGTVDSEIQFVKPSVTPAKKLVRPAQNA